MRWTYHVGNTNANATLAGRGVIKEEVKLRVANGRDMSVMRSVMIFLVSNDGPREKHCHEKSRFSVGWPTLPHFHIISMEENTDKNKNTNTGGELR